MLQKLLQRARDTFVAFYAGFPLKGPSSGTHPSNELDELEVLGGRKSVISDNSYSNTPVFNSSAQSPPQQHLFAETNDDAITESGSQMYGHLSPGLLDQYHAFSNPVVDEQPKLNDFDVFMSFVHASGDPSRQASQAVHAPPQYIDGQYAPELYYSHQTPSAEIPRYHSQSLGPMDVTVTNEHNQDNIWPDFIRHLGLTRDGM